MADTEHLLTLGEAQAIDYRKLSELGFSTGGKTGFLTGETVTRATATLLRHQRAILYIRPNPGRLNGNDLASLTNHLWNKLIQFEHGRLRQTDPHDPDGAVKALLWAASQARQVRQSAMSRTALHEWIDSKLCMECKGSSEYGKVARNIPGVGLIYKTCEACDGRTWIPWTDQRRIAECGIRQEQWAKRYEAGYHDVLQECAVLHRQAVEGLKACLFGPALIETKMQRSA